MSIIYILAKELANTEELNGKWPTLTKPDGEVLVPDDCTQTGSMTLAFDEPVFPYIHWRTKELDYMEELEDVQGLPYISEYQEGETVTKEEYEQFVQEIVGGDHSKLKEYFQVKTRENVARISELNEQVGKLVNEIATLSAEAGIEATVNLGHRGSLDLDGPWDSSSAYC